MISQSTLTNAYPRVEPSPLIARSPAVRKTARLRDGHWNADLRDERCYLLVAALELETNQLRKVVLSDPL